MHRCLQLAQLGAGNVAPNPMVGAVLVYNNIIIGEGYHQQYGQAHAEVNCLNSVSDGNKSFIKSSTLYVSLEPCAHFGKTPPCADLIIENKIPTVVIGCSDQYCQVNGKGIAKLINAGVQVITGVLEEEAKLLNKMFFTFHQLRRPYIILKWAQTQDHKIAMANFTSVKISNDYSNRLVHKWRSQTASIMVGTNTALHDNPLLTNRLWAGNNPVRIVIDKNLQLPSNNHLFTDGEKTIIFNTIKNASAVNIEYCKINDNVNMLPEMLTILYLKNIQSILVEGGAILLQSFINQKLWDEARVITNNKMVLGNGIAAPNLSHHQLSKTEIWEQDQFDFFLPILNHLATKTTN